MKHLTRALGLAALLGFRIMPAAAQDYPARPIRVITATRHS
jgi:tripartite-type tricarboxylate transporter receptor subunit TctC